MIYASVNSSCAGHLPTPRGCSRAFDTHTVSYQNITTQRILLEKKQISSSVKDRFYACISLLLIETELHSETRELST